MHIFISALSRFTQPTGICRHAANLARCLDGCQSVAKITFVTGRWQEKYFRNCLDVAGSKLELITIDVPNASLARNRWFATELPRLANAHHPDIIHLSFPVPVFRSRFASPIVVTIHDLYPYDFPETFGSFNSFWKRAFFSRCIDACDGVACVSENTLRSLQRRFPKLSLRVPVRLVHNYADFPARVSAPPPLGLDPRPFILTVAQHQRNKRLDLLLHAFQRLRSQSAASRLRLLVVGSVGAETDELLALTKTLRIESYVHWLAPISNSELAWLYQNCELFVASSCVEGFCLPLLEALYFSCRVVASDIPVFHEVAGNESAFFDLSRTPVNNLARAMEDGLRTDRVLHSSGLRFSRQSTADECLSLYSLVLKDMEITARAMGPVADHPAQILG